MIDVLAPFHFLRPLWLLGLLVLPLVVWRGLRDTRTEGELTQYVDPPLRAHVLLAGNARKRWLTPLWLASLYCLAIVALAGPAWRQQAVTLYSLRAPLVVALDLSSHMAADDIAPDRITRARYQLMTLLKERAGGQVALIAYAGDAFTVAPMTDDAATVIALLDSLSTALMPVDGQRADRALRRAAALLAGAGFSVGDVLLVTDAADASAREAALALRERGIRVSVLGVGTPQGAALRDARGALVYDRAGVPQLAQLDEAGLRALASAGGGRYARLQGDGGDLKQLGLLTPDNRSDTALLQDSAQTQRWRDDGVWLLPLLLLLALPGFRRGGLMTLFAVLLLPAVPAQAVDWDALWHNREQRADAALRAGDVEAAQRLARDPQRAGAAAYRAGQWDAAAAAFAQSEVAVAQYNLGNALAQAGRFDEAIAAYDRALQQAPDMADAKENRALIEQLKKQQDAQQSAQPDDDSARPPRQPGDDKADQRSDAPGQRDDSDPEPLDTSNSGDDDSTQAGESGDPDEPAASPQSDDGKPGNDGASEPSAGAQDTADTNAEQQAQQALSEAVAKALAEQGGSEAADGHPGDKQAAALSPEQRQQREQEQAVEAALRRVPDDPGGLLRRKFVIEYQRREAQGEER